MITPERAIELLQERRRDQIRLLDESAIAVFASIVGREPTAEERAAITGGAQ